MLRNLSIVLAIVFFSSASNAQTAVDYLNSISKETDVITKSSWEYTKTASHSKNVRLIDAKRTQLIKSIDKARTNVAKIGPFAGSTALRDTVLSYLNINYNVMNNDYAKLMDLDDVKEQSYNDMEAYLLAKKIADEKLDMAVEVLNAEEAKFCAANNITLLADNSELGKKMKISSEVYEYYNKIYLAFFKPNFQENSMMDAINKKDVAAIEQTKNALIEYADESLIKLMAIGNYKGDNSLILTSKKLLEFYKEEAQNDIKIYTQYYIELEKFEKLSKAIEANKNRKQADIDEYNKALAAFNKLQAEFNATNDRLNNKRTQLINMYNEKCSAFTDKHVPK